MRTIDADALEVVGTIIPSDIDTKSYVMGMEYILNKIDSLPTIEECKWIPCSERLPEEDGDYLVLYYTRSKFKPYAYDVISFANDLYQIDEYDFIDRKGQKGWFYCDREYGFCEDNSIYAWMPLPEPYREERDEHDEK